jgi:hypothetical protein
VAADAGSLRGGYGAALWAREKFLKGANREVSGRIRGLRTDIERELGTAARVLDHAIGPLLLWSARREARLFPAGRPLEPRTIVERRNW